MNIDSILDLVRAMGASQQPVWSSLISRSFSFKTTAFTFHLLHALSSNGPTTTGILCSMFILTSMTALKNSLLFSDTRQAIWYLWMEDRMIQKSR